MINTNYKNIAIGILCFLIGQSLAWFQAYGYRKLSFNFNFKWVAIAISLVMAPFFIEGVHRLILAFNHQLWPSRFFSFCIGNLVFTVLSMIFFQEPFTWKALVSNALCLIIILIQFL